MTDGRAIARPSRILLATAGLYLLAALWMPAQVDLDSAIDGVFFDSAPAVAEAEKVTGSLLAALGGAELRVEHPWIEAPLEVHGRAELQFDLYERAQRQLLLRADGRLPATLTVHANQMTLRQVSLQRAQRFYRWELPTAALRLGTNRFAVELRDPAGQPAEARISWARVSGNTLPPSGRSVRIVLASLGEVELPAVAQFPGTGLALELEDGAAARALRLSIGTYSGGTGWPASWGFHVLSVDDVGHTTPLFSRRLETGGTHSTWHPAKISLDPSGSGARKLLFVVEGRTVPEQYALWGDPRLVYQGGG